ncbi:MAG: antibiotic biosynthesis monooxygenase [Bermanella sp.]
MEQDNPLEPVTLVISKIVKPNKNDAYEAWAQGINKVIKRFDGFIGVDVIRPRDNSHNEYVVIIRFDNIDALTKWQTSPICRSWLSNAQDLIETQSKYQKSDDLELWFTLPGQDLDLAAPSNPPYYKKVVVGILSVYPLIMLSNIFIAPYTSELPYLLRVLLSVVVISSLMSYPMIPWISKLLGFWLYPKKKV